MAAAEPCALGADLGGTKIALAAVDRAGSVMLRMEVPSPADDSDAMVGALVELVAEMRVACGERGLAAVGLGMGAAGFILQPEGRMLDAPNIAWVDLPLKQTVNARTGLPTFLDNDANAAALGERLAGACRGVGDFVYLTLGTGIGGGICADGRIYRGHRGTAAELGHMVVEPEGPMCTCGRRGCLEALASGTALAREAAAAGAGSPDSLLMRLCDGDTDRLTGEIVAEAAERGDPAALAAFEKAAGYLGIGIVSLIHIFDPELVVLGGGVSRSGHLLLPGVNRVVAQRGLPSLVEGTSIVLSTLGSDAGIVGAAALVWEGIEAAS